MRKLASCGSRAKNSVEAVRRPEEATPAPFMFLYALHDALLKPMPGKSMVPAWPSRGACRPTGSSTSSCCAKGSSSTTASPSRPRTSSSRSSARLAMLKRGEADIAYGVNGEIGEEVRRTPGGGAQRPAGVRSARRRVGARAHRRLSVVGPVRGPEAQMRRSRTGRRDS